MTIPVIHVITMLELGGAQQNTLHTVAHLDSDRFQPYLMAGPGGILDGEAAALAGVPVVFVPDLVREVRPRRDLAALWRIRSGIRRVRRHHPGMPLIVHTHSSKAGILGRWAAFLERVPVVIHTFHGFGFHVNQPPWVRWTYQTLERWTGKVTHRFIAVSRANMDVATRCRIARPEQMVLIRSGIPIRSFQEVDESREEIRRGLGLSEGHRVVTMVACLKSQKAPCDFVEVARRVRPHAPDAVFLLAGDGALRPEVEERAAAHGLGPAFRLLGWRRDVPQLLRATDVLVLTSRWEGLPRVLPQAMAAGVPVIATAVDGSPEAVQDGVNGFVVPPGDVDGMAQRVLHLLRDPALRQRMGDEGRSRVGEFDIDRMVHQQEALYDEMVAEREESAVRSQESG
jgi:glycosyltransferase involved in cell wall biosynthesis